MKTIIGKLDDEDVLTKWKNHTLGEIIQEIMDNQEYKSRIVPNGCYAPKELLAVMSEEIMSNEKLKSLKLRGLRDETTIKNGKCGSGLLGYAFDVPVTSGPKQTLLLYTGSEGRAVEGTSGNDMTSTDWVNNFRMGLSDYSNQYNPAVEFAKDMTKDGSVGFVTGHSQGGNDYIYSYGGNDTLSNSTSLLADNDKAVFGYDRSKLIFSRSVNDLKIQVAGQTDNVLVQNWYLGGTNTLKEIDDNNASAIQVAGVDQLVQAMATFTTTTGISWEQAALQNNQQYLNILSANYKHV